MYPHTDQTLERQLTVTMTSRSTLATPSCLLYKIRLSPSPRSSRSTTLARVPFLVFAADLAALRVMTPPISWYLHLPLYALCLLFAPWFIDRALPHIRFSMSAYFDTHLLCYYCCCCCDFFVMQSVETFSRKLCLLRLGRLLVGDIYISVGSELLYPVLPWKHSDYNSSSA